jgi:hypothetical protein
MAKSVKRFQEKHGFSREEAIMMTIHQFKDLQNNLNNLQVKRK